MGRILAIDYGRKRVGIAVSDPLKIIANGLTTVKSCDILRYLSEYLAKEEVERIVVGLPKTMRNEESESMQYIKPFVEKLKKLISENNLEDKVELSGTFCLGKCQQGVCVMVDDEFYSVSPDTTEEFFNDNIL